jgi:hypothetical protein
LIRVYWVDICESPTAEVNQVHPALRYTECRFRGYNTVKGLGRYMLLSDTYDMEDKKWVGATAIPTGVIRRVEKIA